MLLNEMKGIQVYITIHFNLFLPIQDLFPQIERKIGYFWGSCYTLHIIIIFFRSRINCSYQHLKHALTIVLPSVWFIMVPAQKTPWNYHIIYPFKQRIISKKIVRCKNLYFDHLFLVHCFNFMYQNESDGYYFSNYQ